MEQSLSLSSHQPLLHEWLRQSLGACGLINFRKYQRNRYSCRHFAHFLLYVTPLLSSVLIIFTKGELLTPVQNLSTRKEQKKRKRKEFPLPLKWSPQVHLSRIVSISPRILFKPFFIYSPSVQPWVTLAHIFLKLFYELRDFVVLHALKRRYLFFVVWRCWLTLENGLWRHITGYTAWLSEVLSLRVILPRAIVCHSLKMITNTYHWGILKKYLV